MAFLICFNIIVYSNIEPGFFCSFNTLSDRYLLDSVPVCSSLLIQGQRGMLTGRKQLVASSLTSLPKTAFYLTVQARK